MVLMRNANNPTNTIREACFCMFTRLSVRPQFCLSVADIDTGWRGSGCIILRLSSTLVFRFQGPARVFPFNLMDLLKKWRECLQVFAHLRTLKSRKRIDIGRLLRKQGDTVIQSGNCRTAHKYYLLTLQRKI